MNLKDIINLEVEPLDTSMTIGEFLRDRFKRNDSRFINNGLTIRRDDDWEMDIYITLVESKVITGIIDEDGFLVDFNKTKGDEVIRKIMVEVFGSR